MLKIFQPELVAYNVYQRKKFSKNSELPPIYTLLGEVMADSKEHAEKLAKKTFEIENPIVYKKFIKRTPQDADSRVDTEQLHVS